MTEEITEDTVAPGAEAPRYDFAKEQALAHAVNFHTHCIHSPRHVTTEDVVATAESFAAFLKGETTNG